MMRAELRGWRAAALVAAVYIYFLIFAQFAFLQRLAALGFAGDCLNFAMASMAIGGMLASLLAPIRFRRANSASRLRLAMGGCALSALLSLLPLELWSAVAVAAAVGISLGFATVTLVADLRNWAADGDPLWMAALGTGVAYLACNIPAFFTAPAKIQSIIAALLCVLAIGFTRPAPSPARSEIPNKTDAPAFPLVLVAFLALVWLDSAAFFIIQQTPALKADTWQGTAHLWSNGILHFSGAILSAALLTRCSIRITLAASVAVLGAACLLLAQPQHIGLASLLYPVGVSLYSVALVAYPAVLGHLPDAKTRAQRAGALYAIAGWAGSALGIGMGQHLGHVPPAFVGVAMLVVLMPLLPALLRTYWREMTVVSVALLFAGVLFIGPLRPQSRAPLTQIERGRQVYISEGCIHCHSQYVRPGSTDELLWGPTVPLALVHQQQPPLIGNRRQGPDLSQVGGRRSAFWLKMHFFHPAVVSGASAMPSYAFLFADSRGADLVAYLASLHSPNYSLHQTSVDRWQPSAQAFASASPERGRQLYQQDCATCHNAGGATHREWGGLFHKIPPDLSVGPWRVLDPAAPSSQLTVQIARIARFGIPGTDMPGHEVLSPEQAASIGLWLAGQIPPPSRKTPQTISQGDRP
jgi:cytochrome c oxidase cbb3-type subunit 2